MKPINTKDINKYPDNYDWLSNDDKEKVTNYMNRIQNAADRWYQKFLDNHNDKDLGIYQHTLTGLTGAKNAYASLGIMIEYDWPNHKHEWYLATKQDAENYINSSNDPLPDYPMEEIKVLLSYGDIL